MNNIFRPVDFWKSALLLMTDNSFFELLRSVFGKIKTPFNKQQLINDLEVFLLRDDIQKTIADYIDKDDAKIIAATALFGEPVPGELESFFTGELSYAQLQDIIVNLEERFILYRFSEESLLYKKTLTRLALNPVLEQALCPFTADISALFPSIPKTEEDGEPAMAAAVLNDRILAGLLSFVFNEERFFRSEGVIRKRTIEGGKHLFPGFDLTAIFGGLQILGLFYADGEKLIPDRNRFDEFASISARERKEYCTAGILVYGELKSTEQILPPLFRARTKELTNFIHHFLDSLSAEALYPEKSLSRLAEIIKAKTYIKINNNALFSAMEKTGLLATASSGLKKRVSAENDGEKKDSPFIAIDSGVSILVYPEINFKDALTLARFLNIKEAGAVVRFEMDKDSAVRAFDIGIGADEIIELLNRLSKGKIDDSFVWNLKDWEKRHGEVSIKKGAILTLSQDKRYITETRALSALIKETLAPGIYLLDEEDIDSASDILRDAGIDIIARKQEKTKNGVSTHNYFPSPSSGDAKSSSEKIPSSSARSVSQTDNPAATLTENFHSILKKMKLSETERAELSARINRRLVLCPAQLKDADIRYEKLEARHMDYTGKQNIARQAIAMQSPVEITWGSERIFGVPQSLEKEGDQLILILGSSDDSVTRIPLGKVSLLRRIKKSIFEI